MAANKSVRKEMGFLMTTLRKVVGAVEMMLFDTRVVGPVSILILVFEAILLEVIIRRVPYTEIDYSTYMQQVTQIEQGELDYDLIGGDTGPIVYPGGYVFIYSWMKVLTGGMEELWKGQELFRVLYLLTMGLTLAVYLNIQEPYRVPPYVMYLLAISKRLHSIYVLRLFNDCFTTFFMVGVILLLQLSSRFKRRGETLNSDLLTLASIGCYALGVSIKMNALLYLPGLLLVVYFLNNENLMRSLGMLLFGCLQFCGINQMFLLNGSRIRASFLRNAFDFNRIFTYKWSVNWQFINEETFCSPRFHKLLLLLQLGLLTAFLIKQWLHPFITGKPLYQLLIRDGLWAPNRNTLNFNNQLVLGPNSSYHIAVIMMSCNIVGVLCARSLHYQFLSWYAYSVPILVYGGVTSLVYRFNRIDNFTVNYFTHHRATVNSNTNSNTNAAPTASRRRRQWAVALLVCAFCGAHELAWDMYPPAPLGSTVLVSVLSLIVVGNLFANPGATNIKERKSFSKSL